MGLATGLLALFEEHRHFDERDSSLEQTHEKVFAFRRD
jgi:hypothetical protein